MMQLLILTDTIVNTAADYRSRRPLVEVPLTGLMLELHR